MKNVFIYIILTISFTHLFASDSTRRLPHLSYHDTAILNKDYHNVGVIRFLGSKSLFFTHLYTLPKQAGTFKYELLGGQINEGTAWYSYFVPFSKKIHIGFFAGPGVSYSFNKGQGFRLRWQYGFSWARISEKVPFNIFILSNITYDFRAHQWTLGWINPGISYQITPRIGIQIDCEGYVDRGSAFIYTATNIGFSFIF